MTALVVLCAWALLCGIAGVWVYVARRDRGINRAWPKRRDRLR